MCFILDDDHNEPGFTFHEALLMLWRQTAAPHARPAATSQGLKRAVATAGSALQLKVKVTNYVQRYLDQQDILITGLTGLTPNPDTNLKTVSERV